MTIEDISNYCEIKDATVILGDPEVGFITIDGTGIQRKFNNYRRFLALNELSSLPNPRQVVEKATVFRISEQGRQHSLTRTEFEAELQRLQNLVS